MAVRKIQTKIRAITRRVNSADRNPRYTVVTDDGVFGTIDDGAVNYGLTNSEYRGGDVILTVRGSSIIGVSAVSGEYTVGVMN